MTNPEEVSQTCRDLNEVAVAEMNRLSAKVFRTRGGRAGSGLGSLLEALWGFMMNEQLKTLTPSPGFQLAWFPDHAYNDFACVFENQPWIPATGEGEILRVEAKSMYCGADESKAHFDVLESQIDAHDLLLVLVWDWVHAEGEPGQDSVVPQVTKSFLGNALGIAKFRDALHSARRGSFVAEPCPDECDSSCAHIGEPLNSQGKRERRSGPETRRPQSTSHAANFGGMVRMLKTNSEEARSEFREWRASSALVHEFVSFMHSCFPKEEGNQYLSAEWVRCAQALGLTECQGGTLAEIQNAVRGIPGYQETLRFYVD